MYAKPKMINRILISLMLLVVMAMVVGFSPPTQEDTIDINVQVGFGGNFRPTKWTPVRVTVRNNSTDSIDGRVQIRAISPETGREQVYYSPFFVRFGETRTEYLYVSFENQQREFTLDLLDAENRVVESRLINEMNQVRNRDLLLAVVSEADQLIDMTQRRIGSGVSYQTDWTPREIPNRADALRSLDVIVFYGIGNARLDNEQQLALQEWVQGGGHLIVHGGAGTTWRFAQDYLNELLPAELQGSVTVESIEALGRFTGYPAEALLPDDSAGYVLTRAVPNAEANVLLSVDNNPVLIRQTYGTGLVDFVGLDPVSNPLNDYDHTDAIWSTLMLSRPARPSWGYDFEYWESADNAIRIVTGFELPSAIQMLAFLALYIFLIGPFNYLVLQSMGRRELAWFTIPIVILIFSIIAYFTGFSLRGDAATVNHLAVVQVSQDADRAHVDGLVGVFSPRRTTYDVGVDQNMSLRTIPGLSNTDSGIAEIPIEQEGEFRVVELPVDAGIIATFATSGFTDTVGYNGRATWTLTTDRNVNLSGNIQLAADSFVLEDAVVLATNSFLPIGDLQPGENVSFNFDSQFPVFLGQPTQNALGNRRDLLTIARFASRPTNTLTIADAFGCSNLYNPTLGQVLYEQDYNCSARGGDEEERLSRRRALLIQAVNNEMRTSDSRDSSVYVAGWVYESPFNAALEGTDQEDQYESLYIFELPTDFTILDGLNEALIAPGLLSWTLVDTESFDPELSPYNSLRVDRRNPLTFRFAPAETFQNAEISHLDLLVVVSGSNRQVQVALWNWEIGAPEIFEIDVDTSLIEVNDPRPYLGPFNEIKVLVAPAENREEVFIQTIEPFMYTR